MLNHFFSDSVLYHRFIVPVGLLFVGFFVVVSRYSAFKLQECNINICISVTLFSRLESLGLETSRDSIDEVLVLVLVLVLKVQSWCWSWSRRCKPQF